MNTLFVPLLENHLNHEQLISNSSFIYQYANITMNFSNYAKDFELSNDNTKGLEAFMIFGLESSTENCTKLPSDFD
jgi:hypothetical protein